MTVKLEDRPIEQVREEVIDKLIYHYSHGVISAEAFERRLDAATARQSHQEIVDLASDLTMNVDDQFNNRKQQQFSINYASSDIPETETMINVLGGSNRTGMWEVPKEIKVLCLMGGADIDFSDAICKKFPLPKDFLWGSLGAQKLINFSVLGSISSDIESIIK